MRNRHNQKSGPFLIFDTPRRHMESVMCLGYRIGSIDHRDDFTNWVNKSIGYEYGKKFPAKADVVDAEGLIKCCFKNARPKFLKTPVLVLPIIGSLDKKAQANAVVTKLAEAIGTANCRYRCDPTVLSKTAYDPIKTADKTARQDRVCGAYRLKKKKILEDYKSVLLVDDLVTTGATLNEAARVIKASNKQVAVFGFVLARNNKHPVGWESFEKLVREIKKIKGAHS